MNFKKCLKCKEVRSVSCYWLVSLDPLVYTPVCAYCKNAKPDKEATRQRRLASYREYTQRRYAEMKKRDPGLARRAWAKWDEQHREYKAIRGASSLDAHDFIYEVEANDKSLDPHSEAERVELHDWLETSLTEQEYSAVMAFSETLDENKAARALGISLKEFTSRIDTARAKAKAIE